MFAQEHNRKHSLFGIYGTGRKSSMHITYTIHIIIEVP